MTDESVHIEDPTPVIPAREFLRDAIGHLAGTLRSTAQTLDETRGVLGASAGGGPGDEAMLGELDQVLDDVRHVASGAKRALRRYRNLKPTQSDDAIRKEPSMSTEETEEPKPDGFLMRIVKSPALHVALPVGVVAYVRITTGQWPSVEQIGIGAALLIARGQAFVDMVSGAVKAVKPKAKEPPPASP